MNMDDPFRTPDPSPTPQKESRLMKDFFEGLERIQHTLAGVCICLFLCITVVFWGYSCGDAQNVRADTVLCIRRCGDADTVDTYAPCTCHRGNQ